MTRPSIPAVCLHRGTLQVLLPPWQRSSIVSVACIFNSASQFLSSRNCRYFICPVVFSPNPRAGCPSEPRIVSISTNISCFISSHFLVTTSSTSSRLSLAVVPFQPCLRIFLCCWSCFLGHFCSAKGRSQLQLLGAGPSAALSCPRRLFSLSLVQSFPPGGRPCHWAG